MYAPPQHLVREYSSEYTSIYALRPCPVPVEVSRSVAIVPVPSPQKFRTSAPGAGERVGVCGTPSSPRKVRAPRTYTTS